MAKFRSKLVACYMCSKACQKSRASQLKCHALWAKLNHKNVHIAIARYDRLFLYFTSQWTCSLSLIL